MKPMVKNLLLVLLAAVALAIGIRVLLAGKPEAQPATPPSEHMLVAAADLPAGLLLRPAEFIWKPVAAKDLPKDAILQNSVQASALSGSLLHHSISRDTPILLGDIIRPDAPGFLAAALKPGLRAVSIAITDVSGNAGLIQPDDHIDLLLTQMLRDSKTPSASVASETIATNMRVIAVGSSFRRPKDNAEGNGAGSVGPARTITLEVSPHAAEVIAVAARLGELSMSLRSFATNDLDAGDDSASLLVADAQRKPGADAGAVNGPVWAGDISQATRSIKPERKDAVPQSSSGAPERKGVLILRGSTQVKAETPSLAALNTDSRTESLQSPASFNGRVPQ